MLHGPAREPAQADGLVAIRTADQQTDLECLGIPLGGPLAECPVPPPPSH